MINISKFLFVCLFLILISQLTFAGVYPAGYGPGSSPKQPFSPGWYVRLMVEGCGGCDIAILLPNNTLDYATKNFQVNTSNCFYGIGGYCGYVDYLTPDIEGKYEIYACGPTGCDPLATIPTGYFYVKDMPAFQTLEQQNAQLQSQVDEHTSLIASLQTIIIE